MMASSSTNTGRPKRDIEDDSDDIQINIREEMQIESIRKSNWVVRDDSVRDVPPYYPMEKSSRVVESQPSIIAARISDCCRAMSVQAHFDNEKATASLSTMDHVEIYLSLWRGTAPIYDKDCIVVEAQRRRGSVVNYYGYCRKILDAASGKFDSEKYAKTDGVKRGRRDLAGSPYLTRKITPAEDAGSVMDKALVALNIAAGLIRKDRLDAQRLGMESLCLLTDPSRAGMETAKIAARVVLLDTAQEELVNGDEVIFDESAELRIREVIISIVLGDSDDDSGYDSDDSEEKEHKDLLFNLALVVMANALAVYETPAAATSRLRRNSVVDSFLKDAQEMSSNNILSSLLGVLGQAQDNPHDSFRSAQCLGSLFQGSDEARRKARDLNAKQIVLTALDVGQRTHVKLANASQRVIRVLAVEDEEDEDEDENEEQN
mmetsp:Transcript_42141/g.61585  ORF Transcript_42141/g.61585 Transcript_42141/m.61585 type:complete len:433 (+) Transcript_42141:349-1647(+)